MATKRFFLSIFILTSLFFQGYSQQIFTKTYGHFDYNYGKDILVEPDGYIVLGNTGLNNGNSTPMLIRIDTAGKIVKYTTQNSNDILSASKLMKLADKIYVCGTSNNTETNDYDSFISIYDTSLTFIKMVVFGGNSWDFANKIAGFDTLIYVAGQTYSTPNGFSWGTISKFNLNGDSLDTYYYGMDGEASINSLIIRGDTELIYTGWYQAPDSLYPAAFAASSTLNGTLKWNKNLSADLGQSVGYDLTNGKLDKIFLCGTTEIYNATSNKDAFTYVLDPNGNYINRFIHIQSNDDEMASITSTSTGRIFTVGYTKTFGGGKKDFWFLGFDENGVYQMGNTFGTQYDEIPESIKYVPSDSGAIICGTSYNSGFSNTSILVLKLNSAFLSISTPTHEVAIHDYHDESRISCYPNPATDKISFEWNSAEQIESIEIFDILGHPLMFFNQPMIHENTIDISSIASQLIIIKVNTSSGSYTYKLIKQ